MADFNLFAFLESVVQGLIAFVYSVVVSLWAVLRRPVTGPLRLHGRFMRKDRRQLGGVTFLYLGMFASLFVVFRTIDFSPQGMFGAASEGIVAGPTLDLGGLWPIILGALAGTVAVDAPIHLWLRSRWGRQSRRAWFASAAEYSLALAVVPSAFIGWFFGKANCPDSVASLPWTVWAAAALVLLFTLPSAVILGLPLSANVKDGKADSARGAGHVVLRTAALLALVTLAGFAAVQVALAVNGEGGMCLPG